LQVGLKQLSKRPDFGPIVWVSAPRGGEAFGGAGGGDGFEQLLQVGHAVAECDTGDAVLAEAANGTRRPLPLVRQ